MSGVVLPPPLHQFSLGSEMGSTFCLDLTAAGLYVRSNCARTYDPIFTLIPHTTYRNSVVYSVYEVRKKVEISVTTLWSRNRMLSI